MAESERRFEDIARKLATMEGELERSTDRCTSGEFKCFQIYRKDQDQKTVIVTALFSNGIFVF